MSRAQAVVIISGIALSIFILEMVRRRRLREEYSWLWLLAAIGYLAVAIWPGVANAVARFMGSQNPIPVFTFIGIVFLFLIAIQFSVQVSRLTEQSKDLSQQVAILDSEVRALMDSGLTDDTTGQGVELDDDECTDHRLGGLVPGSDQHQPTSRTLAEA